ncbi:helicase-exonuclease AddAB subunit AddB [Exiguobacterium alkaliphilum]|uniref:Helicase-exonuclease AddAB subunit AddB n=1 Tax=Exiguobacterium alkaliphilum TaxID=1428684 RepID=A0ABT2KZU4_9BACL|nr:helicase-exonuclease AddAB subunit AddB [Exiguobacterium alkaliphilum]MCT4796133.1 helicase-exonuclease AddAB subunit AddB [Exiguobacterium alkaliphilum]
MTVTFHVGRSGSGKSETMMRHIIKELKRDPSGPTIYLLVPDQMSFEMERKMAMTDGLTGSTRVQVLSMRRLAFLLMRDHGISTEQFLDQTGTHLLLRRVVEMNEERLTLFRRTMNQYGFYEELNTLITMLKRGLVDPEQLLRLSEQDPHRALKLQDLSILYEGFMAMTAGKALHAEDYFNVMLELLPEVDLTGTQFYVDGFNEFSEQELAVLVAIAEKAPLSVLLTIDPDTLYRPNPLFGPTQRTLMRFKERLSESRISSTDVPHDGAKRFTHPSLAYLEATFGQMTAAPYTRETNHVSLEAAVDRTVEVEAAVREVMRLVREDGYRYRDIAFVSRSLEAYGDLASQALQKAALPFFLDERQPMLDHPVVELLKATVDIALRGYREEPVFRALKTELVLLDAEHRRTSVDRLEAFVIERGIKHYHWHDEWQLKRRAEDEAKLTGEELDLETALNRYRQTVVDTFDPLLADLKAAKTMQAYTHAIYHFLERIDVAACLSYWRDEALEDARLLEAREHTQVWDAVLHLLEQLEAAAPEETLSTELFLQMMDTGLDSLRYALVPPSLDQLTVTDYVRGRLIDKKVIFLLGANEDQIPLVATQSKLLTDHDLDFMHEHGVRAGKATEHLFDDETYYVYKALTAPSHRLYVSYALVDRSGKAIQPAGFVADIKTRLLNGAVVKTHFAEAGEHRPADQLRFITNVNQTAAVTALELQRLSRHYPIQDTWFAVYNELLKHPEGRARIRLLTSALFYQNVPEPLSKDVAKSLYTNSIRASVSRLETFQACPFRHFASYGLRLRERRLYRLEAPDIGNLYHRTIEHMSQTVKMDGKEWRDVDQAECVTLAESAVELVTPEIQHAILMSSNRYGYLKKKLTDVVTKTAEVLIEQSKRDGFDPVAFELAFGSGNFPPVSFTLSNGATCELVGRIDRVDTAQVHDQLYVRIVDYKSSKRDIDFAEIYYGLAMQMLIYLKVLIEQADAWTKENVAPAAALYFHVHRPLVTPGGTEADTARKVLESYQMQGLLVDDPEVLDMMDRTAKAEAKKSIVIPVKYKKDGTIDANTVKKVVTPPQLEQLMDHAIDIAEASAEAMYDGTIGVEPYEYKERRPCQTCPYQSVCHFDEALANEPRQLKKLEKNDVLSRLGGDADEVDE